MNNKDLVSNVIHTSIDAGRTVGLCEAMSVLTEYSEQVFNSKAFTNQEKSLVCTALSVLGDKIDALRKNIEK